MNKPHSVFCAPHMVSEFTFTEMINWADFQNGQLSEKIQAPLAVC